MRLGTFKSHSVQSTHALPKNQHYSHDCWSCIPLRLRTKSFDLSQLIMLDTLCRQNIMLDVSHRKSMRWHADPNTLIFLHRRNIFWCTDPHSFVYEIKQIISCCVVASILLMLQQHTKGCAQNAHNETWLNIANKNRTSCLVSYFSWKGTTWFFMRVLNYV